MKNLVLICIAMFSMNIAVSQTEIESVILPDTLVLGNDTLVLNGAGVRVKAMILKLYVGGLYLENIDTNADSIIAANKNMNMRLVITSGRVSSSALVDAMEEGFEITTDKNTAQYTEQIESLGYILDDKISYKDTFDVSYEKDRGVVLYKNSQFIGIVAKSKDNLKFKQDFFAIWLGDKPADKKLRRDLLNAEDE